MYKAIFIDLDGTLLKKDHSVSDFTVDVLQKLIQKNILVVLVSARPLSGIMPIAERTGLHRNPVASLNGAYIYNNGKIVFDAVIENSVAASVHEHLQNYSSTPIYYHQDEWFAEKKNAHTDHEQRITSIPITIQPFISTCSVWQQKSSGPNKILVVANAPVIEEIQSNLKQQYSEKLTICTSKPTFLEIMHGSASKLNAVKMISEQYKLKQEEIIAIGDNFNDVEMISYAGLGIAMGNAPEPVKAIADYVTDTNNNDGVAKAILKFLPE